MLSESIKSFSWSLVDPKYLSHLILCRSSLIWARRKSLKLRSNRCGSSSMHLCQASRGLSTPKLSQGSLPKSWSFWLKASIPFRSRIYESTRSLISIKKQPLFSGALWRIFQVRTGDSFCGTGQVLIRWRLREPESWDWQSPWLEDRTLLLILAQSTLKSRNAELSCRWRLQWQSPWITSKVETLS